MSLGLTNEIEFDRALIGPALREVAGPGGVSLQLLGGGRNSRVYRVDRSDHIGASAFVAKVYYEEDQAISSSSGFSASRFDLGPGPGRDRRGCEFAALRFLWTNGVRCIPEPIATFPEQSLSILRLVEGTPLRADDVMPHDIDSLVDFLVRLDSLKRVPASCALPDASEACFSLDCLAESIRTRLAPLRVAADLGETPANQQLRVFLADKVSPAFERAFDSAGAMQKERGLALDSVLPFETRTLSPSDFGFHNALRCGDESLVFLDFEHFGWDDPAKMVTDFLLHPALPISLDLRRRFMRRAIAVHPARDALAWRVPLVLPLYAVKWCTILLNEFVPEHRRRRAFAKPGARDSEAVLFEQLARAESLLASAIQDPGGFRRAA